MNTRIINTVSSLLLLACQACCSVEVDNRSPQHIADFDYRTLNKYTTVGMVDATGGNVLYRNVASKVLATVEALLMERNSPLLITATDKNGRTPLHDAIQLKEPEVVMTLLEKGANPNTPDNERMTPLHLVAATGDITIAEALLEKKARIGAWNNVQDTALHIAARMGHAKMVELLLWHGADIFAMNWLKQTPLHCAALGGSTGVAKLLLGKCKSIEADGQWNQSLMLDFVSTILGAFDLDASGSVAEYVNQRDEHGKTPIYHAASKNHYEIVKLLIENGARFIGRPEANSPLRIAVSTESVEVIEVLFDHGAKNENCRMECAAVMLEAIKFGITDVVELLSPHAVCANIRDRYDVTPLHFAAQHGMTESATILIRNGADVEAESTFGLTPLHFAAAFGQINVLNVLLAHNAHINAVTWNGDTPLNLAKKGGHAEAAKILSLHRRLGVSPRGETVPQPWKD